MANGPVNVAGTQTPETTDVLDVPYAAAALVYTGVKQSPAWINYDASKMEIGGQIYGIEAGSYTANFTPKANYIWREDGSQQTKSAVWVINKPKFTVAMEATGGSTALGWAVRLERRRSL